jgi:dTDP-4-amino-4,6-dideoxygalactose transaminase/nucleoside-diphosphate-sugar epimerase
MKHVLVTGGAGYLGSRLSRDLLEAGFKVRCFDRLYFGRESVADLLETERFELIEGNITHLDRYPELFDGISAVVHLAGLANDPSCDLDPEMTELVNTRASVDLAQRARRAGVERFVFASSCSVYGAASEVLVDETSRPMPVSLYARSKLHVEEEIRPMAGAGFVPVILRLGTLFGLSPRMRFDLAINLMSLHAVTRGKIFVLGGGRQWRPFLHVSDATRCVLDCLEAPADDVAGQILNVGSSRETYQIVALAELAKSVQPETVIEVAPEDEDRRSYNVSFDKLKKVLGREPSITAHQGFVEVTQALRGGTLTDLDSARYFNIRTLKEWLKVPAVSGGEPIRATYLPLAVPTIGEAEEQEVLDTLRSGWITTGPKTKRFENDVAQYVGAPYALAVNSCTAALHLALAALEIGPGDEVITSPITWPSTANVVVHVGATPVFVDVERPTLNMDPDRLESRITSRTKAVIPVHMAGQPCDLDRIREIARRKGLAVIEDAAHAIGARYKGKMIGSISEMTCFSFYPIKNMTTIEGGIVISENKDWIDRARLLSLHGVSHDAMKRYGKDEEAPIHWECLAPGFKYNMTDVQASLGLHQLRRVDGFIERRAQIARLYDEAFMDLPEIIVPSRRDDLRHAHHLYIVMVRPELLKTDRDGIIRALRAENIGTGVHFRSLHVQPWYRDRYGFKPEDYPNALFVTDRVISLPLFPAMTQRDAWNVVEGVRKVITHFRRGARAA